MDEKHMQENDVRLKDAYRREEGLLTSSEISGIRAKYGISQSDLCVLLGWGVHKEQAYVETAPRYVLPFKYAENLQI